MSKRLWVGPSKFLVTIHALVLAEWTVKVSEWFRPQLPAPPRRGPKQVYAASSILVMALVHVAWQMIYEEVIDYFYSYADAAAVAGFPAGRVISAGQYGEGRRAMGIYPFWFLFLALVWQLVRMSVIFGKDGILDATTQQGWFHNDPEAAWGFPKPGKDSV